MSSTYPDTSAEPEWMAQARASGWRPPRIKKPQTDRDRFRQLHFAAQDFQLAAKYARTLREFPLWCAIPLAYEQAASTIPGALHCALAVTYMRPFTHAYGLGALEVGVLRYDGEELELHDFLKTLRNEIHAHRSGNRHDAEPKLRESGEGLQVMIMQPRVLTSPSDIWSVEQLATKAAEVAEEARLSLGISIAAKHDHP